MGAKSKGAGPAFACPSRENQPYLARCSTNTPGRAPFDKAHDKQSGGPDLPQPATMAPWSCAMRRSSGPQTTVHSFE